MVFYKNYMISTIDPRPKYANYSFNTLTQLARFNYSYNFLNIKTLLNQNATTKFNSKIFINYFNEFSNSRFLNGATTRFTELLLNFNFNNEELFYNSERRESNEPTNVFKYKNLLSLNTFLLSNTASYNFGNFIANQDFKR
jgi:hypothetical protein